ncbi:MAG: hypothetical protein V1861_00910, partial [Candidatus Micrarchaeota archaeon]
MTGGPQQQEERPRDDTSALRNQLGVSGPMIPRPETADAAALHARLARADAQAMPVASNLRQWASSLTHGMTDPTSIGRRLREIIPHAEQPHYQAEIRSIENLATQAESLRGSRDPRAEQVEDALRSGIAALARLVVTVSRMRASGLEPELVQSMHHGFTDMIRPADPQHRAAFRSRGNLTLDIGDFRASNSAKLAAEPMRQNREVIDSWIVGLGNSASRTSGDVAEDARIATELTARGQPLFNQISLLVTNYDAAQQGITAAALGNIATQMGSILRTISDETYRRMVDALRRDLENLERGMSGEERTRPSEAEILRIETQVAFVQAAQALLEGLDGPAAAQMQTILGRGLKALRENKADQASLQLFIARQFRSADASLRRDLLAQSEGLDAGTKTTAEVISFIGTRYIESLNRMATLPATQRDAIRDPAVREMLSRISASFSGRTLTIEDLTRLSLTQGVATDIRNAEREFARAGRAGRENLENGLVIFRRALSAIEMGASTDVAGVQRELGRRYLRADAQTKANIERISARLHAATQIRAMDRLISSPDLARIADPAERARAAAMRVLGPGTNAQDPRIAALLDLYNQAGQTAEERERFVRGIDAQAGAFIDMLQRRDGLGGMLEQLVRQRRGENERGIIAGAIRTIDGILNSLGLGQQVDMQRVNAVRAASAMIAGNDGLIIAAFASSEDADEREVRRGQVEGLHSMPEVLQRIRDRRVREQASSIYQKGMAALQSGNVGDALAYFSFAQSYALSGDTDRWRILQLVARFDNRALSPEEAGRLPEDQRPISSDGGQWLGRLFLDRAAALPRIRDPAQRSSYLNFSNAALRAFENGDMNGAMMLRNLAGMYGRATTLNPADPNVQAVLRLPQGSTELGLPPITQILDRMQPPMGGWQPSYLQPGEEHLAGLDSRVEDVIGRPQSRLPPNVRYRAVTSSAAVGRTIILDVTRPNGTILSISFSPPTDRTLSGESLWNYFNDQIRANLEAEVRLGIVPQPQQTFRQIMGFAEGDAGSGMQTLSLRLTPLELGLEQAEFGSRGARMDTPAAQRRYTRERERLERLVRRAGDPVEREALQREIALVNPDTTRTRLDTARTDFDAGVALLRQAGVLRLQVVPIQREARAATDEAARTRLQEQAAQLAAQADSLTRRGRMLMQAGQGLQGAALGIDRSIGLNTLRAESGRVSLDAAARSFEVVSREVRASESLLPGTANLAMFRLQSASADLRSGTVMVSIQQAIHQEKIQLYSQARALDRSNDEARDRYVDRQRNPIMTPEVRNADGSLAEPPRPAYDHAGIARRITSMRGLIAGERLPAARAMGGRISSVMATNERRAIISAQWWDYRAGASDRERATGLRYFDGPGLMSLCDRSERAADRGDLEEARSLREEARRDSRVGGEAQGKYNVSTAVQRIITSLEHDQGRTDPQSLDYDPTAAFGYMSPEEQQRDPARFAAHMRNVRAVERLGIFDNIRTDRAGVITSLGRVRDEMRTAAAAVQTEDDVLTDERGRYRSGVSVALVDSLGAMVRQLAMDRSAGRIIPFDNPFFAYEDPSAIFERMSEMSDHEIMGYLYQHPNLLRSAVAHARSRSDGISDGAALGILANLSVSQGEADYREHATGWNFATLFTTRALEQIDGIDDTTRYHILNSQERFAGMFPPTHLLQYAEWASRNPQDVRGAIERGSVSFGLRPITFARDADPGGIYDNVSMYVDAPADTNPIAMYRSASYAELERIQRAVQGMAPSAETTPGTPEHALRQQLGESGWRAITGQFGEARSIADADVRATFAVLGFDANMQTNRGTGADLSIEQQQVAQRALMSIAQARGNYINIAASLRTWVSHDDRGRAFEGLARQTSVASNTIDLVLSGRRRGWTGPPDARGRPTFSVADRDRMIGSITRTDDFSNRYITDQIRIGQEDDRNWGYATGVFKIVGAGLVCLIPGGQVVVAGYFLAESTVAFEEQRVTMGGLGQWWEQNPTSLVVSGGAIPLSVVGLGSAVGQAVVRNAVMEAAAMEGVQLSRGILAISTGVRYSGWLMIRGGVLLGAGSVYDLATRRDGAPAGAVDYGFAVFNAAQPFLMMGAQRVGIRAPALVYESSFRSYAYRGFMATLFGWSRSHAGQEMQIALFEQAARARISISRTAPNAVPQMEAALQRPLGVHDYLALQQHYSSRGTGGRVEVLIPNPAEAAGLLRGYERFVDSRVRTLSPDAFGGLQARQRELNFGPEETVALVAQFGDRLATASSGEVARFLETSRRLGASESTLIGRLNEEGRGAFGRLNQSLAEAVQRPLRLDERVALLEHFGQRVPSVREAATYLVQRERAGGVQPITGEMFSLSRFSSEIHEPAREQALQQALHFQRILVGHEATLALDVFDGISRSPDGTMTYTRGSGDSAVSYSQEHVTLASDTLLYAESIAGRPSDQPPGVAAERVRTSIREQLILEGRPVAEAEAVATQRARVAMRLASDPEFRRATFESPGQRRAQPDRRAQMDRSLAISSPVLQAEQAGRRGPARARPPPARARVPPATGRDTLRDTTLTRMQLLTETFSSIMRSGEGESAQTVYVRGAGEAALSYSEEHVGLGLNLAMHAENILRRPSGQSLAAASAEVRARIREQLIRDRVNPTQADAIAGERNRAVLRLATDVDFRRATLDEGGLPRAQPDRAAQLGRGLEFAQTIVPESARPRPAGLSGPPQMPITEETRVSVRGNLSTLFDRGHAGIQMGEGIVRETYMFEGRPYSPEEGRAAAQTAAAADFIVRRRLAGESVPPERIPRILAELGLPGSLSEQVRRVSENPSFREAVRTGDDSAKMRVALTRSGEETAAPEAAQPRLPGGPERVAEELPEAVAAEVSRRHIGAAAGEGLLRRAQSLNTAFLEGEGLTLARARELGLATDSVSFRQLRSFLEMVRASEMTPVEAATAFVGYSRRARPPPILGMVREGGFFEHVELPGRQYGHEQYQRANNIRMAADAIAEGREMPAGMSGTDV